MYGYYIVQHSCKQNNFGFEERTGEGWSLVNGVFI